MVASADMILAALAVDMMCTEERTFAALFSPSSKPILHTSCRELKPGLVYPAVRVPPRRVAASFRPFALSLKPRTASSDEVGAEASRSTAALRRRRTSDLETTHRSLESDRVFAECMRPG